MPEFRGKGYGKEALIGTLQLIQEKNIYDIELDVESKNDNALNLYKACGFEEVSVMNYYEFKI
ncbi:N-acetyltransferase [Anaerobacillus sp. CMMVII]|uniref:GNAT family N-acetyltransferase n=1 Tax=Anaerobacillus sp. CMMVII TaxID=2755588 RepID=UPI0021B7179E|nr:GNAT family N-acetyltransferase [Anaerobacillus sp. CMMVII]